MKTYPLTQTQLGIYVDSHGGESLYHNPLLARLPAGTDPDRLVEALKRVIAAHPGLSARITADNEGNACWMAGPAIDVEFTEMRNSALLDDTSALMPRFDLEGGPLALVKVIATEKGLYLFLDVHHCVYDGYSRRIFLEDLDKAYAGNSVRGENFTVFDLSRQEREARESDATEINF